ncbi:hypothetical protein TELCIR_12757 [Teladorsagia circumcincta]|uniref:Uncharacterized protein n=1 Tax=Teladorsagia circumcincta TaxID=45464 RepID=A0A2G9U5W4_TELCI|nr:hypothetical protein TELCIR_12757 [Teladorsagia circumcincta]
MVFFARKKDGLNPYHIHQKCVLPPPATVKQRRGGLDYSKISYTTICINDTAVTMYMNRPDVRQALGIPSSLGHWAVCNNGLIFKQLYNGMEAQAKSILSKGLKGLYSSFYRVDESAAFSPRSKSD